MRRVKMKRGIVELRTWSELSERERETVKLAFREQPTESLKRLEFYRDQGGWRARSDNLLESIFAI